MEDVLDIYAKPYNVEAPVICFDESPFQLLNDVIEPLPARPGSPRKQDTEYDRAGTCSIMMICQPAKGLRKAIVMERRTKKDFAACMLHAAGLFPLAERVIVVLDNLNTHGAGSFYEAFEPEQARALAKKIEFHYTPLHGSWLNIAELELAVLGHGVLKKRIGSIGQLQKEIDARCASRNHLGQPIKWQFNTQVARGKLSRLYPDLNENFST
jgi:hypothetical protein